MLEAKASERAEFDEQMFEKELRVLREVVERGARKPPQDLSYTVFVLAVLWLVIVVPLLAGALLALVLSR
jgi:hypothetical protein